MTTVSTMLGFAHAHKKALAELTELSVLGAIGLKAVPALCQYFTPPSIATTSGWWPWQTQIMQYVSGSCEMATTLAEEHALAGTALAVGAYTVYKIVEHFWAKQSEQSKLNQLQAPVQRAQLPVEIINRIFKMSEGIQSPTEPAPSIRLLSKEFKEDEERLLRNCWDRLKNMPINQDIVPPLAEMAHIEMDTPTRNGNLPILSCFKRLNNRLAATYKVWLPSKTVPCSIEQMTELYTLIKTRIEKEAREALRLRILPFVWNELRPVAGVENTTPMATLMGLDGAGLLLVGEELKAQLAQQRNDNGSVIKILLLFSCLVGLQLSSPLSDDRVDCLLRGKSTEHILNIQWPFSNRFFWRRGILSDVGLLKDWISQDKVILDTLTTQCPLINRILLGVQATMYFYISGLSLQRLFQLIQLSRQEQKVHSWLFDHNHLSHFGISLNTLQQIETLDMSWAGLKTTPPEINVFSGLRTLNLSTNHLRQISPLLCSCTALTDLNLAHNEIFELPLLLASLSALTALDLSWNRIPVIPPELAEFFASHPHTLENNPIH